MQDKRRHSLTFPSIQVLQRAGNCGVGPILTYTTDDSKLEALVRTAKENAGAVYCMLGVHSDNIKRANDRLAPARLESLKDLALEGCCVAVMAGLAFRDVGIRYAQERALSEQMELAAAIALPLVLYEVRASEALVERIADEDELRTYLALGCYIVLTGRVCDQTEKGERLRELAATIPADRLILASDSPFATPQNIDDVFMREGRNEPSNLPYLLTALAAALGLPEAQLAAATRRNALTVLFTEADTFPHQDDERAVFAATKPRNKKGRGKKGGDDGGDGLCSMHFLSHPLPWMQSCMQSEGGRLGEGRLDCPTCAAKLGKWAAGPGSEGGGVACSCGVLVPAPAFALDIASADQKAIAETVAGGGMGAVKEEGEASD
eukprot:XP_001702694.1 predicted protein [Chlamydomonas reinhardtii]